MILTMLLHSASRASRCLVAACIPLLLWAALCSAQQQASSGLSTSAEYIVGFVRHVHWQSESQLQAWRVCIVGELPQAQERAYADRIIRGKPFAPGRVDPDADLGACQIVDLTAVDIGTAERVLQRLRKVPIMSVGLGSEFCSAGGQFCLHLGEGSAGASRSFEVNLSTIRESSLQVSARLLTVGSVRSARLEEEP